MKTKSKKSRAKLKKSPKDLRLRIVGVMTGTSCDGLDASCLEFDPNGWRMEWNASAPYPSLLRDRVMAIQSPASKHSLRNILELDRDLGKWFGSQIHKLIQKNGYPPDLIANHGQTVAHFPQSSRQGSSLQLGDPSRIAVETGISTVSHFRQGDIAAGGEGAPLAPLFHRILAHHLSGGAGKTAIHNLGGFSNLTYIGTHSEILAFDTGPAGIWMDAASALATQGKKLFDENGILASQGKPDSAAVKAILKNPFFSKPPPKSTGRDDFPFELLTAVAPATNASIVATATEITVESIAQAYEKWIIGKNLPLKQILFCGGGAKNPYLLQLIQKRLPQIRVTTVNELGFESQFIESQAFAFFGFNSVIGQPLGGSWTGVQGYGPPGQILPGENWSEVLNKIQAFNINFKNNTQ